MRQWTLLAVAFGIVTSSITAYGQQAPQVVLNPAGGGGRQSDLWVQPGGSIGLYAVVYDGDTGQPIPNLTIEVMGIGAAVQDGGHDHFNGYPTNYFTPASAQTGPNGEGAYFEYGAGPAAALVWPFLRFTYQTHEYNMAPQNGVMVGFTSTDMPYLYSGAFVKVGATTTHPINHYGTSGALSALSQLAGDYHAQYPQLPVIAINDISLRKGGLFDIAANYSTPHATHREGRNADIRANGGPNSIPFDSAVRQWFVQRAQQLGFSVLHESPGTSNEHYHLSY